MSASRLHHVACGTHDVARLARFYNEVLGLPELGRQLDADGGLRSVWLDLEGAVLMIERTQAQATPAQGVGAGLFLLAFRVSPEERERCEERLIAAGSAIESSSEWSSYARDPDGNRIALSHYPEPRRLATES